MFFSIVCASNNPIVLNNVLLPSLNKQSFKDYELIIVDARQYGFSSASETLNYGAMLAKGEYIIFVHHDVELLNTDFLYRLKNICDTIEFGVAGVAGVIEDKKRKGIVVSSVVHGPDRIHAGKEINVITEVKSIDECFFVVKKTDFHGFSFLGKTWHLYGPDYSLKCLKNRERVLVLPLPVYHVSPGWSMSPDYFDALYMLCKQNRDIKMIFSTMGVWKNAVFLNEYCFYHKVKLKIKKFLKINRVSL